MIQYEGCRTKAGPMVTVSGDPLDPRHDLHNHCPEGFDWGFPGNGPAQLALAILADHLRDDEAAVNLHQRFKWAIVAKLPERKWTLTSRDIELALNAIQERESST